MPNPRFSLRIAALIVFLSLGFMPLANARLYDVGAARVDITPDFSLRLMGYATRKGETAEVAQPLWVKALAIAGKPGEPFLLLTVDVCAIPAAVREEVLRRLAPRGMTSERFAVSFSHTHSGPCIEGAVPNMFAEDIPAEEQARISRYTAGLVDKLERAGIDALAAMQPARLEWGTGKAHFAGNRRQDDGLVDHDVPVLAVKTPGGKIRAVLASYACHATTFGSAIKAFHGDWPGVAQETIERDNPGAIALIAIGCGAESNPTPRGSLALVEKYGQELATEVGRLLAARLRPISGDPVGRTKSIDLAFDRLPTRAEWNEKAKSTQSGESYHARRNLARLDRGETLPTSLSYLVQTWTFGDDLAMVFLPGEVVADYSLRLKEELDFERVWINAYTNATPAYIPSRRVIDLGGYEGAGAMLYYDHPARFAAAIEEQIVGTVRALVPASFLASARKGSSLRPTTAEEARGYHTVKPAWHRR